MPPADAPRHGRGASGGSRRAPSSEVSGPARACWSTATSRRHGSGCGRAESDPHTGGRGRYRPPMYAARYAADDPHKPAIVMATSGEVITFGEYEAASNRMAHLYRDQGLQRLDHVAFFMENNP